MNKAVTGLTTSAALCAIVLGFASPAASRARETVNVDQVAKAMFPKLNEFWAASFRASGISAYRSPKYYWWYNQVGASGWIPVSQDCDSYGKKDGQLWRGQDPAYDPNSFYCPSNEQIYLDHTFLTTLGFHTTAKWGRGDDGRVALVIAHEFAHHIQKLLKWSDRRGSNFAKYELQADCYAGTFFAWGEQHGPLERGDALQAVAILGYLGDPDGTPWYEPQAHGTFNNRQEWFIYDYETSKATSCDRIWTG